MNIIIWRKREAGILDHDLCGCLESMYLEVVTWENGCNILVFNKAEYMGYLTGLVSRVWDSWSQGGEFKSHIGHGAYLEKSIAEYKPPYWDWSRFIKYYRWCWKEISDLSLKPGINLLLKWYNCTLSCLPDTLLTYSKRRCFTSLAFSIKQLGRKGEE